jgi:hypothetical protein
MANEAVRTSKLFERRESSGELHLEILRNRDRVSVDRDSAAGVVSTVTGCCAVKSAIKNKWLDGLSSCSRTQQRNGEKFKGSRKHLGEECRLELMEGILTTKESGFIPTSPLPGTV